jgi:hypothetical protein
MICVFVCMCICFPTPKARRWEMDDGILLLHCILLETIFYNHGTFTLKTSKLIQCVVCIHLFVCFFPVLAFLLALLLLLKNIIGIYLHLSLSHFIHLSIPSTYSTVTYIHYTHSIFTHPSIHSLDSNPSSS